SRKVMELDTRGSHFYLAMYWAEALANQNEDQDLRTIFSKVASSLKEQESKIIDELKNAQGVSQNIGGYYKPNSELAAKAMRPSQTLNGILANI
ncbi:MAG: NADP-dependent isocitrate dehydrogenase, partial [Maribacter sp.]|nr:NADP-dependent isocitrate dehydrogenase [Maribacter sp.]